MSQSYSVTKNKRKFSYTFAVKGCGMDVYDKITLNRLSQLIDENLEKAEALGYRISWGFTGDKLLYSRLYRDDQRTYEKLYSGSYTHILIADMHQDLCFFFDNEKHALEKSAKIEDSRKLQEAQDRKHAEEWDAVIAKRRESFLQSGLINQ